MRAAPALLLLGALAAAGQAAASTRWARYLLVAAPRLSRISYLRLDSKGGEAKTLIDTELGTPQGLAVDQVRDRLVVADPALKQVLGYLLLSESGALNASKRTVIAQNVEPRWVAVDTQGNVFFTDEVSNTVQRLPYWAALRGNSEPEIMYDGTSLTQVSKPGGIATDNFHLFWTNKLEGNTAGSLVRADAAATSEAEAALAVLSKVSPKAYGVCVALNNVFYTDPEQTLYGVKSSGGPVVEISTSFVEPRGCAFDGDGTVYVADRGDNSVLSFSGNMQELQPVDLQQVAQVEDAFALAVFSGARAPAAAAALLLLARLA